MNKDLGTYHIRVEFKNARGFFYELPTGSRYTHGGDYAHPLTAQFIPPEWENEEELISGQVYYFTEGNFSCDCNKRLSIARAYQEPEPDETLCGDTIITKRLTLIRPDQTELVIWP